MTDCGHPSRTDGVCDTCGHCLHELVLNGACYYCGSTELPRQQPEQPTVVPVDRLRKKR